VKRVLVSRQPIYRSDSTVLGYELLYRDADSDHASFSDGAQATAQVLANTLVELGMDELVGRHLAFINFERTLLLSNYCVSIPPERVVIEILETVKPEELLLKRLGQLRGNGYRIALDDFICDQASSPFLEYADFVKVDLSIADWSAIESTVEVLRGYPAEMIAEKVETSEQFNRCQEMGFRHFQGYFFCRPQNMSGRSLPVNRTAAIRLLTQINNPNIQIHELEEAISQNVLLSYKLLRYINSAICGLGREVESIRHATVLVGLEKIRIWASLIVFSGFEDTSQDVLVTGALRARMCEQLARALHIQHPERCFLVGLFSVLDAILDRPLGEILASVSLSTDVAEALIHRKNRLGEVLGSVQAYERQDWKFVSKTLGLTEETIRQTYVEALAWSMRTMKGVAENPVGKV
jgi:EAL and modified HD-GYP domain-containing signal transduction protein